MSFEAVGIYFVHRFFALHFKKNIVENAQNMLTKLSKIGIF